MFRQDKLQKKMISFFEDLISNLWLSISLLHKANVSRCVFFWQSKKLVTNVIATAMA